MPAAPVENISNDPEVVRLPVSPKCFRITFAPCQSTFVKAS